MFEEFHLKLDQKVHLRNWQNDGCTVVCFLAPLGIVVRGTDARAELEVLCS